MKKRQHFLQALNTGNLLALGTFIFLTSTGTLAETAFETTVDLVNLLSSKTKNVNESSGKGMAKDAVSEMAHGFTYFGEKLIANSAQVAAKAANYEKATERALNLLRNTAGNEDRLLALALSLEEKGSVALKKSIDISKFGEKLKITGKVLGVATAGYEAYTALADYNEKSKTESLTPILDMAILGTSELKALVPIFAPGVGGAVITATDLVVQGSDWAIDKVLSAGRGDSLSQADNIINFYNNSWNIARQKVLQSAKNGEPLSEQEIANEIKKQGDELNAYLINIEAYISNHIADGDVAVNAFEQAKSIASRMQSITKDDNLISTWSQKSNLLALDYELKNLAKISEEYKKELESSVKLINEVKNINNATSNLVLALENQNQSLANEKNNQLIIKSIDIKEEENVLRKKQKELDDKKKELANTNKYIIKNSENTSYDPRELAYLQAARNLSDKYGYKLLTEWSVSDQIKLKTLAENLDMDIGSLFSQLQTVIFNSSSDTTFENNETKVNLDYKNIEGQISKLTDEIKPLNQNLTLGVCLTYELIKNK